MRIIIAGGGASGLFAAYILAGRAFASKDQFPLPEIIVFEANPVFGKKILSTGNGHCNLCNTQTTPDKYYCEKSSFVEEVLKQFSCQDAMWEFEKMGVALKDRDGYIYPASMQAATVSNALISSCRLYGVQLIADCQVRHIRKTMTKADENAVFRVETTKGTYDCNYVIQAYGSNAGLKTDHITPLVENLKHLGHTLRPLKAALCSVYADMSEKCYLAFFKTAGGVRTEATVSLEAYTYHGELQLTEYGLSGIVVFQLSHPVASRLCEKKKPYPVITVDFFPTYESRTICSLLTEQIFYAKRTLLELFSGLLNRKLAQALLQLYAALKNKAIRPELKNVNAGELAAIVDFMKHTPFPVSRTNDLAHAQVCSGGIPVNELHQTLASKRTKHLYFCGECIDVDGICGGYNLMWAWATGYVAATAILSEIQEKKELSDESC